MRTGGPGLTVDDLLDGYKSPLLLLWGELDPWIRPAAADKIQVYMIEPIHTVLSMVRLKYTMDLTMSVFLLFSSSDFSDHIASSLCLRWKMRVFIRKASDSPSKRDFRGFVIEPTGTLLSPWTWSSFARLKWRAVVEHARKAFDVLSGMIDIDVAQSINPRIAPRLGILILITRDVRSLSSLANGLCLCPTRLPYRASYPPPAGAT